jgi:riboflavin synthase
MFTGLVESMGRVRERAGTHLAVDCGFARELVAGESVAVNGVCLTVEVANAAGFTATTVPTTLRRTTLGTLTAGSAVNLERALGASARLGGHIVQGHVDGIGALVGRLPDGEWELLRFAAPVEVLPYVVPRGAIAVDGVSLTVAERHPDGFTVAIVPHTAHMTTLGALAPGGQVNLEADILAKYVEGLLVAREGGAAGA